MRRSCSNLSGRASSLFLILLLAPGAAADVIYVDANATGPIHDGSSWCNGFTALYEALEIAPPGAMLRVADGLYLPDATGLPDPREATFRIAEDLTIAGAYAGCGAPDPDERDPFAYVTTLSGDLDGDDAGLGIDDNAYHVVTVESGAAPTLSGVVIRAGHAEGREGGGILSLGGRPILMISALEENRAWRGGAIYAEGGDLHLFQCRFTGNVTTGEGGAVFAATADLEAHNSLFVHNSAGNDGGALFCDLLSAGFFNCSFGANASEGRGGGIYDYVGVETTAGNCIFWGNTDMTGGGQSAQIYVNPSNILFISYSCIQGWTGDPGGEGNIGDDPLLVDLPAGDMHLLPGSPCIDSGSNDLVGSQLDLDGNPRIVNGTVDMGCYEYQGASDLPDITYRREAPRILSIFRGTAGSGLTVRFVPPREGAWSVGVYSADGRRLALLDDGFGGGGPREISWSGCGAAGRAAPSGIYLFVLSREGRVIDARKGILLR
jgi:predicted outer membrane repeat protein